MVYLLNTNLHPNEKIRKALTSLFGIGFFLSNQICDQLGFRPNLLTQELKNSQIDQITRILTQYYVTGSDLKRIRDQNIKRFIQIGCYKGFRCVEGLPMRGQRTHTNAKTSRKRLFRSVMSQSEKQKTRLKK